MLLWEDLYNADSKLPGILEDCPNFPSILKCALVWLFFHLVGFRFFSSLAIVGPALGPHTCFCSSRHRWLQQSLTPALCSITRAWQPVLCSQFWGKLRIPDLKTVVRTMVPWLPSPEGTRLYPESSRFLALCSWALSSLFSSQSSILSDNLVNNKTIDTFIYTATLTAIPNDNSSCFMAPV